MPRQPITILGEIRALRRLVLRAYSLAQTGPGDRVPCNWPWSRYLDRVTDERKNQHIA